MRSVVCFKQRGAKSSFFSQNACAVAVRQGAGGTAASGPCKGQWKSAFGKVSVKPAKVSRQGEVRVLRGAAKKMARRNAKQKAVLLWLYKMKRPDRDSFVRLFLPVLANRPNPGATQQQQLKQCQKNPVPNQQYSNQP
jgi:hypothetical protein